MISEISRRQGSLRQVRDADPGRPEARRDPAGRAQQALQAHRPAVDVRLQRGRARRRRPADALAARARQALPRLPARDRRSAARSTSCARRDGARTRPRGLPDRAREPRRGDRADPRRRRHGRRAHRAAWSDSSSPRSRRRRSSTCGSARSPGLERKRIEQEYSDLQERIAELRAILGDESPASTA